MQLRCGLCTVQSVRGILGLRVVRFRSNGGLAAYKYETSDHSTWASIALEQCSLQELW